MAHWERYNSLFFSYPQIYIFFNLSTSSWVVHSFFSWVKSEEKFFKICLIIIIVIYLFLIGWNTSKIRSIRMFISCHSKCYGNLHLVASIRSNGKFLQRCTILPRVGLRIQFPQVCTFILFIDFNFSDTSLNWEVFLKIT